MGASVRRQRGDDTVYRYELSKQQMNEQMKIRDDSGVPVARQLDYAIETFRFRYWTLEDERRALRLYVDASRTLDTDSGAAANPR